MHLLKISSWLLGLGLFSFSFATHSAPSVTSQDTDTAHFLTLTDIHFDPFIACNNVKPCAQVDALQAAPAKQWSAILKKDETKAAYGKDTSYPLLESALTAAQQQANAQDVNFVLILGDFLGHDYREHYEFYTGDSSQAGYQAFVKKTYQFLATEIRHAFPTTDVYNVLGNNDSYQDDYVSDPNGQFYQDLTKIWSCLIHDSDNKAHMRHDFPAGGYYAADAGNLHIIMLNSSLYSIKAKGTNIDAAAQKEQIWFHNELTTAANHHQKVLIVTHIPMSIDVYATTAGNPLHVVPFWKPQCSDTFQVDLKSYGDIIAGILAGHTHLDWFQILSTPSHDIGVSLVPAVSPQFGNNPAFKIFSYLQSTAQLTDFATYFYGLADTHVWGQEYIFSDAYKPACPNCELIEGMKNLQQTGPEADAYKKYFAAGTDSQPITKKNKWVPYYWCAIRSATADAYQKCID